MKTFGPGALPGSSAPRSPLAPRLLARLLAVRSPCRVLLRDEALHALGEQGLGVGGGGVGPGAREEEELLVLEPLAGRPVGRPVLLILLELLESLEDDDQRPAAPDQPSGADAAAATGIAAATTIWQTFSPLNHR